MKLSDLINPFQEIINKRWEESCEIEDNEYIDYHSFDKVTERYERALDYLKKRGDKE